jgi:hypothetical protein
MRLKNVNLALKKKQAKIKYKQQEQYHFINIDFIGFLKESQKTCTPFCE